MVWVQRTAQPLPSQALFLGVGNSALGVGLRLQQWKSLQPAAATAAVQRGQFEGLHWLLG